jgi:uncharacterized protein (TIGR03067 family)
MFHATIIAAAFGFVLPVAPSRGEAPPGLSGTWIERETRQDGPLSHTIEHEFTVRKTEFSYSLMTEVVHTLQIDSRRDPMVAEIVGIDATGERSKTRFLMQVDGDTLRQCSRPDLSDRLPETLESSPGSGNTVTVWKRVGPAKAHGSMASVDGTWVLVKTTSDGREVVPDGGRSRRISIGNGTYRSADVTAQHGLLKPRDDLHWREPALDLSVESGTSRGEVWMGIFSVDRDDLRLCYNTNGRSRPMSFDAGRGRGGMGGWRNTSRTFRRQSVL